MTEPKLDWEKALAHANAYEDGFSGDEERAFRDGYLAAESRLRSALAASEAEVGRLRHALDSQTFVLAPASTSAELAAAERAVVEKAIELLRAQHDDDTRIEVGAELLELVDEVLVVRAALGLGEQKGAE